jgi:site-specific DNA recombinase
MQGMIAEYEREKIIERTRRGRRYAARQGRLSVFTTAPFGYRRVRTAQGGRTVDWEVVPADAAIIKLIFELVGVGGYSLGQVRRELFARGLRTPTGNEHWDNGTLRGMLTNPAYQGTARYGKERMVPRKPGRRPKRGDPAVPRQSKVTERTSPEEQEAIPVPALVDPKLFQAVGERMEENRKRNRERTAPAHLLSGLLICGCCGCAYCGRRRRNSSRGSYYCIGTEKHRRLGKFVCDNTTADGPSLEELVWNQLCDLLQNPARIRQELERRRRESTHESPQLKELEKTVANLRSRLDRLIDVYTSGSIDRSEFDSRASHLRAQYRRESEALESLRGTVHEMQDEARIADRFTELAHQVEVSLANTDFALKRELLKLLIQRIEIHREEIRIVYKVPSRPFCRSPDNRGSAQHWVRFQRMAPRAGRRPLKNQRRDDKIRANS